MLDVVLLQDLHFRKLVLVDQCLLEHGSGDQRQHAVLPTMEHLGVLPLRQVRLRLLLQILRHSERDRARVLGLPTLVVLDLVGSPAVSARVKLVIDDPNAAAC